MKTLLETANWGRFDMFLTICLCFVIFASVCGVCELTVRIVRKLRS